MIHTAAWPHGTPAWIDLVAPDRHVVMDFYGALFGWEFDGDGAGSRFYTMARKHGQPVAGIGEPAPGGDAAPPMWTTYLAVDDADAVAQRAAMAGATVLLEPTRLLELGRIALLADPTGAVVGIWQAGALTGTTLVNEPGALAWAEAVSHDLAAAREFYRSIFGYTFEDLSGPGFEYVTASLENRVIGGLGGPGTLTPGSAPHWRVYFAVADADAATARAVELGAELLAGPRDGAHGRMAVLAGPAGEQFTMMSTDAPAPVEPGPRAARRIGASDAHLPLGTVPGTV